jgi:hypothetical protein
MRALVAVALVACSASPQRDPVNRERGLSVVAPAPEIAWRDGKPPPFSLTRLPAVARSGEVVVLPLQDNDAGRGNVNLRFEVRDHTDRVVDKFVVMTVDEYERFVPDGVQATLPLDERIAATNRKLHDLHSQHDLVPMHDGDSDYLVTFADDHHLRVRTKTGIDLADVDGSGWLAPKGQRCAQCPPCENPARLQTFYKASEVKLIVVRIAYAGTDMCWEPPDQLHVVAW